MQKIGICFRILLEGVFLWLGGVGLWVLVVMFFYGFIEDRFGILGSDIFYGVLTLVIAIIAIFLMVIRRKDLGERISTAAYIVLTMLPVPLLAALIWMYVNSFD